ncbi:glycosyltransferase family 2 protein [Elizabethkingia anophelis]|uniref:Hyaluronan synthase n=2 Tax=Elizabethkingia anophelis TaxID=1117645 RepID=A0A494J6X2_9FLAO|nr:glycosyltransferase family 2 protein [Elizabethkingia anophelis]AQW97094.1 hypothetical protein BBD31_03920 [Elizabethkingia anophelis]EHM7982201.1 glycosyltransferase family 2 protein [Elizabethkingia anophelis]EHZ9536226.1 glycosyltransferase family 2 protein [Elizabethkingia anophelis]EKU3674135.1 glycosyltransferase family 2 protein [Elizabethkingia anophelis]EKU4211113.1 glycosyltransferase family 2 protein [Elizabethkingia anophelis]
MMENNPLISVIVPCYNQAEYLDECLHSILYQTYQNWECIIVNDGSPDNTEEIALKWVDKDIRFRYIKKKNGGLSSARNAGLQEIKGDWIQLLDCDDFIDEKKFQEVIETSKIGQVDLIITNFLIFKGGKYLQGYEMKREYFTFENILTRWDVGFTIPIHCPIIKSEKIKNIRFNEKVKVKEDWLFWIEVFKHNPKVKFVDTPLTYYRKHKRSMTSDLVYMYQNLKEVNNYIYQYEGISDVQKFEFFKAVQIRFIREISDMQGKIELRDRSFKILFVNFFKKIFGKRED